MKLLIVCPRFPEYGHKGDQLRTRQLLELLAPGHELHVVTGGRPSHHEAVRELRQLARVTLVEAGPLARGLSALEQLGRGRPAEVGWMSPRRLRVAARSWAESCDAVIASTARVVTGPLPAPLILDHIDALSANLRERAELERHVIVRCAARIEARLLARHERLAARWATAQITVSDTDAAMLPRVPAPVVIPHAVFETIEASQLRTTSAAPTRDIDVIFTGNMNYPPNRDAACWLATEITPELRRLRPGTRVMIAGRFAHRLSLDGIDVASDVPDLSYLLRRTRVAIVPLRSGTGVPNKLLEAAAAGTAIVATPRAASAAGIAVMTADGAASLAAAVAELLADEAARTALAARALADLATRSPAVIAARLQNVLEAAVRDTGRHAS
jgi:glycosyltransferase involved in cell wall biosynthesis